MKANELRIGNWISSTWSSDKDGLWRVQDAQCIMDVDLHERIYNPIPLTEEWLLKFGFKGEERFFEINDNAFRVVKYISVPGWGFRIGMSNDEFLMLTRIEYVHQLQNLYFALTGEELTVKE